MLLQFRDKEHMAIVPLWRLIFKFTFEKKSCAYNTKQTIEEQLLKWNGFIKMNKAIQLQKFGLDPKAQYAPVGKKGSILDEMEYQLGLMCSWVVREENGEFQSKVDNFKKHKIDYRLAEPMTKVFPECIKLRNPARGRHALLQNMKQFPEIYRNVNTKEN